MKSLKRTIASLTAVLTTAAMAMSAAPAFAYEDITAAKAEFVNSFNDCDRVVNFLDLTNLDKYIKLIT